MKWLQPLALTLCLLALSVGSAAAQKRTHRTASRKTTPASATVLPPLDVRAAREKVDNQLSNVNVYLDKFGPIALSIDAAVSDEKANKLSPKTAEALDASRDKLVASIRDLKTGLSNLESEFRTKPALQKYLPMIQGITDLASQAEDFGIAGQFVAAKDPLRAVSMRLTDTLAAMPR